MASVFSLFLCVMVVLSCGESSSPESAQEETAESLPIPSADLEGESENSPEPFEEDDEADPSVEEPSPTTYSFDDTDSLIYVQVYKDETAWGSDWAHNHVMRATGWTGSWLFDPMDAVNCALEMVVPTAQLQVDEDAMRSLVGYGDVISNSDRQTIREHMLADDQLNENHHPDIRFLGSMCSVGVDGTVTVAGELSVAGVTEEFVVNLVTQIQGDKMYVQGTLDATHMDFGIQPYSAFGGAVRNDVPLDFTFDMVGFSD